MTSPHSGMRMFLYEFDAKTPESEAGSYVQMAAAAIRSAIAASARLPVASGKDGLLYEALASLERWEGARCPSPRATVAGASSSPP